MALENALVLAEDNSIFFNCIYT